MAAGRGVLARRAVCGPAFRDDGVLLAPGLSFSAGVLQPEVREAGAVQVRDGRQGVRV